MGDGAQAIQNNNGKKENFMKNCLCFYGSCYLYISMLWQIHVDKYMFTVSITNVKSKIH